MGSQRTRWPLAGGGGFNSNLRRDLRDQQVQFSLVLGEEEEPEREHTVPCGYARQNV